MAKGKREEQPYVSFHYLEKGEKNKDNEFVVTGFEKEDFDKLVKRIEEQPDPDVNNEEDFEALKFGSKVPFWDLERVDKRTFRGRFDAAYFGHSYRNSEKGKISAESINQRSFHFLLYLSKSGRIYIGTQYLGLFGDYGGLYRVLKSMIGLGGKVRPSVVRSDAEELKGLIPKEVKVTLSKPSGDIAKKGVFSSGSVIVFTAGGDDEFADKINASLLPLRGKPEKEIKKEVAALLSEGEAYSVTADDIEDCVVTARRAKRRGSSTIYFFGDGSRATKFPLNVALNADGHPIPEKTKAEMLIRLEKDIIAKLEDV